MRNQYFPPEVDLPRFHCLHCGVYAQQVWYALYFSSGGLKETKAKICICTHCNERSYWVDDQLAYPPAAPVEPAHPDLPQACAADYAEASAVFAHSPRASAALIRLAIQKLMPLVGGEGENINDDIKTLVSKGLPLMVQQALDVCRVVGNNAVHPGEMDLNDTPEIAQSLFRLINIIVEEMITKPKEIQQIYSALPQGARDAINKRDAKGPNEAMQ
jgi:hypothetical protein